MERHRKKRKAINAPGHAHEFTFSCYRRQRFFEDESLIRLFLEVLDEARTNWNFLVWAYVVMPEHIHVLVRPPDEEYEIADFLRAMKQPVSQRLAAHYRKIGPDIPEQFAMRRKGREPKFTFWQPGGGYDRNMFTARAIWDCIHYIHHNPVKRHLVEEPGKYEWSSFRFYEGVEDVPFRVDRCEVWLS